MKESKDIISFTGLKSLNKRNILITCLKSPEKIVEGCLTLLTREEEFEQLFEKVPKNILAIIPESLEPKALKKDSIFILSPDPRLTFSLIANKYFTNKDKYFVHKTSEIQSTGSISKKITVSKNVTIKGKINIGEDVYIGENSVIMGDVTIGDNVSIDAGTIIGKKGFNYPRLGDEPIEFPHVGKVIIGNNVRIGCNCIVARGSLSDTIINDNVKIDDLVLIGHNVIIGKNTLIAACAHIGGGVIVGECVWLSPQCTIIDHVTIGDYSKIGIGSAVVKNVPKRTNSFGNPARLF